MIFHDNIDQVVDGGCRIRVVRIGLAGIARVCIKNTFVISHQDFTIEHLVISQDIIDHLFV